MIAVRLPIDCDLSQGSFIWARKVLGEDPQRLLVTKEDEVTAEAIEALMDPPFVIGIDCSLSRFSWRLEGKTRAVFSDGG